jgi:hypothetical protein
VYANNLQPQVLNFTVTVSQNEAWDESTQVNAPVGRMLYLPLHTTIERNIARGRATQYNFTQGEQLAIEPRRLQSSVTSSQAINGAPRSVLDYTLLHVIDHSSRPLILAQMPGLTLAATGNNVASVRELHLVRVAGQGEPQTDSATSSR